MHQGLDWDYLRRILSESILVRLHSTLLAGVYCVAVVSCCCIVLLLPFLKGFLRIFSADAPPGGAALNALSRSEIKMVQFASLPAAAPPANFQKISLEYLMLIHPASSNH